MGNLWGYFTRLATNQQENLHHPAAVQQPPANANVAPAQPGPQDLHVGPPNGDITREAAPPCEPPKLPDNSFTYLADPSGADLVAPLSGLGGSATASDLGPLAGYIQQHFTEALSLRAEVDKHSRRLRTLLNRDAHAPLPVCASAWADSIFSHCQAKPQDFNIEYSDLHGKKCISLITIEIAVNEKGALVGQCVQDIITSCHEFVARADRAIQHIEEQHKTLSDMYYRTKVKPVVDVMTCAEKLIEELKRFTSQVLSLLGDFSAAMEFFKERAKWQKTGLILLRPQN